MISARPAPEDDKAFLRKLIILFGSTLTVMAGATISPALPTMAEYFKDAPHAKVMVKMLLSVHALFIAIFAPALGGLMDRFGRKPILSASLILYALGGSSGFFLDSLYLIMAGRAMLGIAVAGIMSGFTTLIGDYYQDEDRNQIMGLQAAFTGFGGLVFLTAGGFLADFGWRYPFLIYLFACLILPGVVFFLYEPQRVASQKSTENQDTDTPFLRLLPIYLLAFLGMLVFYMVPVQLPFYLKMMDNVSSAGVGIAIGTMTLVGALSSMQFRRVKARFSHLGIFSWFALFMGVGYVIVSQTDSFFGVLAGLIVAGLGFGMLMPNANVWLLSLVSQQMRGKAVGILTTFFLVGQFFSPIFFEPLVENVGIGASYGTVGFALIICAAVSAVVSFMRHTGT